MSTVHQRYRRTDRRTTYDSNTALALHVSRGKKTYCRSWCWSWSRVLGPGLEILLLPSIIIIIVQGMPLRRPLLGTLSDVPRCAEMVLCRTVHKMPDAVICQANRQVMGLSYICLDAKINRLCLHYLIGTEKAHPVMRLCCSVC